MSYAGLALGVNDEHVYVLDGLALPESGASVKYFPKPSEPHVGLHFCVLTFLGIHTFGHWG